MAIQSPLSGITLQKLDTEPNVDLLMLYDGASPDDFLLARHLPVRGTMVGHDWRRGRRSWILD